MISPPDLGQILHNRSSRNWRNQGLLFQEPFADDDRMERTIPWIFANLKRMAWEQSIRLQGGSSSPRPLSNALPLPHGRGRMPAVEFLNML